MYNSNNVVGIRAVVLSSGCSGGAVQYSIKSMRRVGYVWAATREWGEYYYYSYFYYHTVRTQYCLR